MKSEKHVVIAYHFFAHYRSPVLNEIANSEQFNYIFVGGKADPYAQNKAVIKSSTIADSDKFFEAKCYTFLKKRLLLQPKLLLLPFKKSVSQIIYLGNPRWPMTWISSIIARLMGKKVFFWTHGLYGKETPIKQKVYQLFYKIPHGLMLYGHMSKCLGIQAKLPADRLYVIYNSLDYDKHTHIRKTILQDEIDKTKKELFPDNKDPIVIASARLTKKKNFKLLLEAVICLKNKGHHVNVLLIGDGPEKSSLQKMAEEGGININLYGSCYDEETLARLLMASTVTVMPGEVGLTAMQSLVYGIPVITHDDYAMQMPEWEAVIPGKNGDLFTRNDLGSLTHAIEKWTQKDCDYNRIREDCYRIIDRFYNPQMQLKCIEYALEGQPANDLYASALPIGLQYSPKR